LQSDRNIDGTGQKPGGTVADTAKKASFYIKGCYGQSIISG